MHSELKSRIIARRIVAAVCSVVAVSLQTLLYRIDDKNYRKHDESYCDDDKEDVSRRDCLSEDLLSVLYNNNYRYARLLRELLKCFVNRRCVYLKVCVVCDVRIGL